MSIEILVRCDMPGCTAEGVLRDSDEQPICADNYRPDQGHVVIDTGWMDLPKGWTVSPVGGQWCATHRGPRTVVER